jgi:hypothetical protein
MTPPPSEEETTMAEMATCPRCNGYGICGLQYEPGAFTYVSEDPCKMCKGTRRVPKSTRDAVEDREQRERDIKAGDTPQAAVVGSLRRRLEALKVVAGPSKWTEEMRVILEAIREFERLARLVTYRTEAPP